MGNTVESDWGVLLTSGAFVITLGNTVVLAVPFVVGLSVGCVVDTVRVVWVVRVVGVGVVADEVSVVC